uniref:Uncharacterized protein n=1 Tax=Anguilla anguilla TaxID=7936 RepID=A0A0E9RGN5_ANGAN
MNSLAILRSHSFEGKVRGHSSQAQLPHTLPAPGLFPLLATKD